MNIWKIIGFHTWTIPSPCLTVKTQQLSFSTTSITVTQISNSPLNLEITVRTLSWTFSTNATVILSQHLFTERRPLLHWTKWDYFTPRKYIVKLIWTLTFCCFQICSSPSLLCSCLNELRNFLLRNGYPTGVINYNINDVLSRQQNKAKNPSSTVPKKGNHLSYTVLGVQSKMLPNTWEPVFINFIAALTLRLFLKALIAEVSISL